MSEEIKFDHFKDINELLKHIDLWYRDDDIEYTRWFGLTDLYNLKICITNLQQKVEQLEKENKRVVQYLNFYEDLTEKQNKTLKQLENIRKEAIDYMEQAIHGDSFTRLPSGKITDIEYCIVAFEDLLDILNKGSESNEQD